MVTRKQGERGIPGRWQAGSAIWVRAVTVKVINKPTVDEPSGAESSQRETRGRKRGQD